MKWLEEFKTFALRGNVVDMAVGIIIGAAFGKIITSLVGDVIMPPIGLILGGVDFSQLVITLKEATATTPAVTVAYGKCIQTVIDFVLVAIAVFFLVKALNSMKKKAEEAPAAPPAPSAEASLLAEIRDLLKGR